MKTAIANGTQLAYETFGKATSEAILLINGVTHQMIYWDTEFCEQLAEKGFYVIRFDNRDVGLSQKFDDLGVPNVNKLLSDYFEGKEVRPPYGFENMADDAVGLLDQLTIQKAHICGLSMGGGIAQVIGVRYPSRIKSLILMMAASNLSDVMKAKPEALSTLMVPAPGERDAYIEHNIEVFKTIGSPGFPFDEERYRKLAAEAYDRCYDLKGIARQIVAIASQKELNETCSKIKAPTLVIHGSEDPLIPVESGRTIASLIPGAELLEIEGMGHDLPVAVWPRIIDAIAAHAKAQKTEN